MHFDKVLPIKSFHGSKVRVIDKCGVHGDATHYIYIFPSHFASFTSKLPYSNIITVQVDNRCGLWGIILCPEDHKTASLTGKR